MDESEKKEIVYKTVFLPEITKDLTASYRQAQTLLKRAKDTWWVHITNIAVRQKDQTKQILQNRFDFGQIEELAHGIIASKGTEPILGDLLADGTFVITAGERRYLAYLLINQWGIPEFEYMQVFLNHRDMTPRERKLLQLNENNTKDFTPIEWASHYKELIDDGMTQAEISRSVGMSKMHVSDMLRLSGISEVEKHMIQTGEVSATAVVDLLKKGFSNTDRVNAITGSFKQPTSTTESENFGTDKAESKKKKFKIADVAVLATMDAPELDKNANPVDIAKELLVDLRMLNRLGGMDSKLSDITFKMENRIIKMQAMLKQHWTATPKDNKGNLTPLPASDPSAIQPSKLMDGINTDSPYDPMLTEAAILIVKQKEGSTSLLQRKLKIGYNRSGRIIDQLEAIGIVGPFNGSSPREVLIPDESALKIKLHTHNILIDDDKPF